jgi:hypothetical protein
MSYYILPKKTNSLILKNKTFKNNDETTEPFISNSVDYYIQNLEQEILLLKSNDDDINKMKEEINPYAYLIQHEFLNIKKSYTNVFFNYIEILKISNFYDIYTKQEITLYCLNDEIYDAFMFFNKSNNISYIVEKNLSKEMINMLCFEIDYNDFHTYIFKFFSTLCKIILHQAENGNCIIKIGEVINKPIIDIIYILTSLYEKIFILKPNASNVFTNERFLVCKHFRLDISKRNNYYTYFNNLYLNFIINKKKLLTNNFSIISNEIPYYFLNKLEDSNIGIGHQRIEHLNILISLLNKKYNFEKVENIHKNNIQKCILWCEKYKLNYNKINEKSNIFINDVFNL